MKGSLTIFLILILSFFFSFITFGQQKNEKKEKTPSVESPRRTVDTHLYFLQPGSDYSAGIAATTLYAPNYSEKEKIKIAIQLKQILDGRGLYVYVDSIPASPNYTDPITKQTRYVLFPEEMPEIYVVKVANKWLYSFETVQAIPRLHRQVYPYGLSYLLGWVPQGGGYKILGIEYWKYIALLLLVVILFFLHQFFSYFFKIFLVKVAGKAGKEALAQRLIRPITNPMSFLIVFAIFDIFFPALLFPVTITQYVLLFIQIAQPVFIVMIAYRLIDFFSVYVERAADKTKSTLDNQFIPLGRKTLKGIVVTFGILYALSIIGVNITALLTGLSIGGIAIGLAAQDTIKNLFGSLTIFIDRPFQLKDWIVADGIDGMVEEIGFRSTRIRTFHDSLIYIPNGVLATLTVDNMGMRVYRRFTTRLTITYDTPPEIIEAFVYGLRKIIADHPDTRKNASYVYLNNFAAVSLEILFYTFFNVKTWKEELRCKHEIMLSIMRLAEELGVRFAFPTQTVFIEEMPGQKTLTPPFENLAPDSLRNQVDAFFQDGKHLKR